MLEKIGEESIPYSVLMIYHTSTVTSEICVENNPNARNKFR